MRCECSGCTRMCDSERMSQCEECHRYFCPSCFDEHDLAEHHPDDEVGLDEYQATGVSG